MMTRESPGRKWVAVTIVIVASLTILHHVKAPDSSLRIEEFRKSDLSKMHNGGKPRAQVDLSTPDSTPLIANAWALTSIVLTPREECDEMVVQFHGIDGIEVQDPERTYSLGSCDPGEPLQTEVRIRGASGVAGYLVADFKLMTRETDDRKGSLTLPFQVGQAKHRPKPAGKTKIAPDGSSFIELNPQAQ